MTRGIDWDWHDRMDDLVAFVQQQSPDPLDQISTTAAALVALCGLHKVPYHPELFTAVIRLKLDHLRPKKSKKRRA